MDGSKDSERKDFESLWADRFADAEATPPEHVWKNISGELANRQVGAYKRRILYYQWAAAAAFLMAVGLGILYFFNVADNSAYRLAGENTMAMNEKNPDNGPEISSMDEDALTLGSSNIRKESLPSEIAGNAHGPTEKILNAATNGGQSEIRIAEQQSNRTPQPLDNLANKEASGTELYSLNTIAIAVEDRTNNTIDHLKPMQGPQRQALRVEAPDQIYGVPVYGQAAQQEDAMVAQTLWAGLNLGSGNFDPNYSSSAPAVTALRQAQVDLGEESANTPALDLQNAGLPLREESSPGLAFAVGLDIGMKLTSKWLIQSGIQYGQFTVNSSTNLAFANDEQGSRAPLSFQNREDLFSNDALTVTSENTDINNNFQFLSIPVKMGYQLVDNKITCIINAGVSNEFYLGNQLKSLNENIDSYSIAPGSASPYKNYFLSGIASLQLGYKISDTYFLNIEPNYKRSLTDFAKVDNRFSSRPSSLGLIVGFRYLLR